jgi:thiol reductant ABC exporter CydC subunit
VIALLGVVGRRRLLLAIVLGALTVLSGAGLLAASGALITGAAQRPETILVLMPLITAVRMFGLSRAALRYVERLVAHDVTLRLVAAVRADVVDRLVPLAPGALVGARGGELLARTRADVDQLQDLVVRLVAPAAVAVVAGSVAVVAVALVSAPLAAVLAVLLLVLGVAVPAAARRAGRGPALDAAAAEEAFGADLLDLVRGLTDHLTGDGGAGARKALDAALDRQAAAERRAARVVAAATACREALPGLGLVAALVLVGQGVATGGTNPLLLAAAALGTLGAFEAVAGLGAAWATADGVRGAARRVERLAAARPTVTDPPVPLPPPPTAALRLEQVTLTHARSRTPAVTDLDLDVAPGEKVALAGPSGAGKSTVLALALRAVDPDDGRVLLGGVDVRGLALDDVRSRVAWAPQVPQLLGSTLAVNLRLGRPDAGDAELAAVLGALGLGHLLDAPGLHGWVGEGGELLSAGERARVALARALLTRADLLLLDEPTAHLDAERAAAVLDLLAADERSVLLVTHDPAALDARWRVVPVGAPARRYG